MYQIEVEEKLQRVLKKLFKKDKKRHELAMRKIGQIATYPYHFKPLRHDLKSIRADHVGHFVLVYRIVEKEKVVKFLDYDHHDKIYKKRYS